MALDQSVLLILDEADAFVEGQLARYEHVRENSLSFRMMKEVPARLDSNDLPRVRTVFSGYRETNTSGGVWANAGNVLVLKPLSEQEAVQFLQGMLARVGVDLGDHVPYVAMRCGFQPAVLIRFGESLLKRLARTSSAVHRETTVVSYDEVIATLGDQAVVDEIRTVVNNNFQGNRSAAVIFSATLLALRDLEPGLALIDAPAQVLRKIRTIDSNLDWLERINPELLTAIESALESFIGRELLTVAEGAQFGVREYRLRFPNFLPVLTQQSDLELEVRRQIDTIRSSTRRQRPSESVLSESALQTVRYWFTRSDAVDCKLVVIGGHWLRALQSVKCGVADRLGCERKYVTSSPVAGSLAALVDKQARVFENIDAQLWSEFLTLDAPRPLVLVGQMALLRSARQYAEESQEVQVEVVTLGRMGEATVAWWFEDARSLHFKTHSAMSQITQRTAGVPWLVACFDRLLEHQDGGEVSHEELLDACTRFDNGLAEFAKALTDQDSPEHLLPREIELLKMLAYVAREVGAEFGLADEFEQYWAMCEVHPEWLPPLSEPQDWAALRVLIDCGFLPVKAADSSSISSQSLGSVRIDVSGAVMRLIDALEVPRAA